MRWILRLLAPAALTMTVLALFAGWLAWVEARDRLASDGEVALRSASDRLTARLDRYRALPQVMASHPDVIAALDGGVSGANAVLKATASATGALDIYLLDGLGTTIASSNWDLPRSFMGRNFGWRPYFQQAVDTGAGAYHAVGTTSGQRGFYFSAQLADRRGVVVVKIDLEALETRWAMYPTTLFFSDENDVVFLGNRPALLFRQLGPGRAPAEPRQYARRALTPLDPGAPSGPVPLWRGPPDLGTPSPAIWLQYPVDGTGLVAHALVDPTPAQRQALLWGGLGAALGGVVWLVLAILMLRRASLAQQLRTEAGAKARLEGQVAERTAELSQINQRLRDEVEERSAAEAALRRVQAELVQAGKLKALGEMSAGISHELNQPLTAIQSLADNAGVLLDRQQIPVVRENLGRISDLAGRMGRIIRNLRAFARKEGEPPATVDLRDVVADALALAETRVRAAGATVRWSRPEDPVMVLGGRVRLQQVLVNLIANAADAMTGQAVREIGIEAVTQAALVRLTVTDTGPGLTDPDRVFDPFFTTKPVGEGLGLGLSISYGIVQSFGGEIRAENRAEQGAVFTIDLPRPQAEGVAA